jgi:membrane dipeptidase
VTLPELAAGGVRRCLGTIFTEASAGAGGKYGPVSYPPGDAHAAYFKGIAQLNRYHAWARDGLIEFFPRVGERAGAVDAGYGGALQLGILMECADPIIDPQDLSFWAGRGVVAVGLTWVHASRYAGGNGADSGVTALGRALLSEMARLDVALDLSHLSERSTMDALDAAGVRVCASHSNCRALLGGRGAEGWQRHLSDETIAAVAARGGVIGLNLYRRFLRPGLGETERPMLADAAAHVDHVCQIAGSARHSGLGTDLDGGFPATSLPAGIDRAGEVRRVLDELSRRGYSDEDVAGIAWGNWSRFFELA